jgi:hypothetical protein
MSKDVDFSKLPAEPRHKLYGFGEMNVGDVISVQPMYGDTLVKLRTHISAHAQYTGKKYRTKTVDKSFMSIQRIA